MAQLVKFDSAKVLKNVGVQLPAVKGQMATVTGKDLTKVTPSAWTYHCDTAEFLGGNPENGGTVDVTNSGTVDVTELDKSLMYEVFYFIALKDHEVKSTVKLTLELPNMIIYEKNVDLTVERNVWQAVSVGKFMNTFSSGNIKFSFSGANDNTWKGLLIQEVMVVRT